MEERRNENGSRFTSGSTPNSNKDNSIIIYKIIDYTLSANYASHMQQIGYTVNALIFRKP